MKPVLDNWLAVATRGLCDEARGRIAEEMGRHVDETATELQDSRCSADEAIEEAVRRLGDAKAARRQLRRTNLSERERDLVRAMNEGRATPELRLFASLCAFLPFFCVAGVFVSGILSGLTTHVSDPGFEGIIFFVALAFGGGAVLAFNLFKRFTGRFGARAGVAIWMFAAIVAAIVEVNVTALIPAFVGMYREVDVMVAAAGVSYFAVYAIQLGRLWLKLGRTREQVYGTNTAHGEGMTA